MKIRDLKDGKTLKIAIYTEDTYGLGFIKNVINRLISEGFVSTKIEFVKTYTPALIKKCHNVRKVRSVIREVDRILIIIDKENIDEFDELNAIWRHLRNLKDSEGRRLSLSPPSRKSRSGYVCPLTLNSIRVVGI